MILPPLDQTFEDFGVAATVTLPSGASISTTVIVSSRSAVYPAGGELTMTEHHRIVTVRRDEVPSTPRDTRIVTELGTWRVDSVLEENVQIAKLVVR